MLQSLKTQLWLKFKHLAVSNMFTIKAQWWYFTQFKVYGYVVQTGNKNTMIIQLDTPFN